LWVISALVIRERARTLSPPPARGRKRKPRKEDAAAAAAFDLAVVEATRAEDATLREAIARSLEDLVPADNSMSMDAALAWSRQDWEREEAEQQWRLLDLAAARHRFAAAAQPARGAPVVKLEDSSDDDWYRPTPPRVGDAGQEVQPLGPQPEQPAGAATAGRRRRLQRRRRRRLHGILPPFGHVERRV
jgi:hypothetical protein